MAAPGWKLPAPAIQLEGPAGTAQPEDSIPASRSIAAVLEEYVALCATAFGLLAAAPPPPPPAPTSDEGGPLGNTGAPTPSNAPRSPTDTIDVPDSTFVMSINPGVLTSFSEFTPTSPGLELPLPLQPLGAASDDNERPATSPPHQQRQQQVAMGEASGATTNAERRGVHSSAFGPPSVFQRGSRAAPSPPRAPPLADVDVFLRATGAAARDDLAAFAMRTHCLLRSIAEAVDALPGNVESTPAEVGTAPPQPDSLAPAQSSSSSGGTQSSTHASSLMSSWKNTLSASTLSAAMGTMSFSQHRSLASIMSMRRRSVQTATTLTKAVDEDGTKLVNDYVLLDELGRGAHGKVKLAYDPHSNTPVAIKIMRRTRVRGGERQADARAVAQLQREIAVMKKLRHRNVVALLEVIDDANADKMYLVMQYVDGGALRSVSGDGTCDAVDPERLALYMRQVCAGLKYLHERCVVHRDIKPENLLVSSDQTVYLADFGVAEFCEAGTLAVQGHSGTLAYMAPELFSAEHGAADGEAVDIWALGVTCFTLLTGRQPFCGVDEIRSAALPAWPEATRAAFSGEWAALVEAMLERDVARRIRLTELRRRIKAMVPFDGATACEVRNPGPSCATPPAAAALVPMQIDGQGSGSPRSPVIPPLSLKVATPAPAVSSPRRQQQQPQQPQRGPSPSSGRVSHVDKLRSMVGRPSRLMIDVSEEEIDGALTLPRFPSFSGCRIKSPQFVDVFEALQTRALPLPSSSSVRGGRRSVDGACSPRVGPLPPRAPHPVALSSLPEVVHHPNDASRLRRASVSGRNSPFSREATLEPNSIIAQALSRSSLDESFCASESQPPALLPRTPAFTGLDMARQASLRARHRLEELLLEEVHSK